LEWRCTITSKVWDKKLIKFRSCLILWEKEREGEREKILRERKWKDSDRKKETKRGYIGRERKIEKGSISPTAFAPIFLRQKSSNLKCKYKKALRKTFVLKGARKCSWNWHQGSISPTFYTQLLRQQSCASKVQT
jgi:hypothetical protein